jgi:hypothetical protein
MRRLRKNGKKRFFNNNKNQVLSQSTHTNQKPSYKSASNHIEP